MSDILQVAKKQVEYGVSLGADQVEVYIVSQSQARLNVSNAHIVGGDVLDVGGAGVRVYKDSALGLASTTRVEDLKEAVEKAYSMAKGTTKDPLFKTLPEAMQYTPVDGLYDVNLAEASFEDLSMQLMEGVKIASGNGEYVVSAGLSRSINEIGIANSLGVECSYTGTNISGSISSKLERGEHVAIGRGSTVGRSLSEFDPVKAGKEAVSKATARIGASKVDSGTMDLIIDYRGTRSSIGSVMGAGVNGLSVALGTSFLSDNIGDMIATEVLTVIDDPHVAGGLSSRSFDVEGHPSSRLEIVEKGVLKTFITDSYSAGCLGIANTGNASKRNLTSKPAPSLTNLIVSPGEYSFEELIKETKQGILMEDSGLGARGNSTNISSMVNSGYYVENGEIVHPVKNTMIGTTVFDFLKNIGGLTKDVFTEGGSTTPAMKLENVKVSGGR